MKLTSETRIVRSKNQVSTNVDGEEVILETKEGIYFSLNTVGAMFWDIIQDEITFGETVEHMQTRFSGDPSIIRNDLEELIQKLHEATLIELKK